jgi:hypothetical protein
MCIDFKFLDELFPTEFEGFTAPKGYLWKVFTDPTRIGKDPELFFGRLFRLKTSFQRWMKFRPGRKESISNI